MCIRWERAKSGEVARGEPSQSQWLTLSLTRRQMERRRHVRNLTAARGALELERLERLRKLAGLLQMFRTLGSPAQEQIAQTLRDLTSTPDGIPHQPSTSLSWLPAVEPWRTMKEPKFPKHIILTPSEVFGRLDDVSDVYDSAAAFVGQCASQDNQSSSPATEGATDSHLADDDTLQTMDLTERDSDISEADEEDVVDDLDEQDLENDIVEDDAEDCQPSSPDNQLAEVNAMAPRLSRSSLSETRHRPSYSADIGFPKSVDLASKHLRESATNALRLEAEHNIPPLDAQEIPSALASLYYQFRQSLPKLAALPSTDSTLVSTESATEEEKAVLQDEVQTVHAMSKRQHDLTSEEGDFWEHLSDAEASKLGADAVENELASLAERSNVISQSYERRTHPPTPETYEECKEILRAMGVPCIESTGPFEAEALASSLVIRGYADYVASEDTVRHLVS